MSAVATLRGRLTTTVGRELLVGVTGLALVGFIVIHLSGNLLIFVGPEAFNAYAAKLHSLGPLLWVARIGLITTFVVHIGAAISLAKENRAARAQSYESQTFQGRKTVATRLMLLSGLTVLFFLFFHLSDFTLSNHEGAAGAVNGVELGLYGLVWNSFSNPLRVAFYLLGVGCLGMHLSHATASVLVTLGILRDKTTANAEIVAKIVGLTFFVGFSSIPVYILIKAFFLGGNA